ncbi:MAG: hypothetical protein Q9169_008022, partial [Polycauliona sp. 2 TL-2023]
NPHALYLPSELRPIITSYIDSEKLVSDTNKRLVNLDPILANSVFDGSTPLDREVLAKGYVPRDALIDRILKSCSPYHVILRNNETRDTVKAKAGHGPKISIVLETRSGNKTVTKLSGVEAFYIQPQTLADELQKTCASSTSVGHLAGSSPKKPVMEVMVQGPQKDAMIKALEKRGETESSSIDSYLDRDEAAFVNMRDRQWEVEKRRTQQTTKSEWLLSIQDGRSYSINWWSSPMSQLSPIFKSPPTAAEPKIIPICQQRDAASHAPDDASHVDRVKNKLLQAAPTSNARVYGIYVNPPQALPNTSTPAPIVDLGYERYQGVADASTGLNTFKGIRFAAPPTGTRRWQPPAAPQVNRDQLLDANALPERCPQGSSSPTPPGYNYTGSEDCLFLSVYAPPNARNLPVFVWIHGGGYGLGQGDVDPSILINANGQSFIGVAIQYRLGAFGFMSSDEIYRYGTVNAGLLDQNFALQWVQRYIHLFGGNASHVTVAGESAGAGSVMLQAMAYGGNRGDSLFVNAIAASPYLPQQYGYADFVPTQTYYAFASAAGCFDGRAQNNRNTSIFNCLVDKDTETLQNASGTISGSSRFGTWAFLPVTDGSFVQQTPSQQLLTKRHNANEAAVYAPRDVVTEEDLVRFIRDTFPLFTEDDISRVLLYYPSTNASDPADALRFATSGVSGATAVNVSTFGAGQQQRATNIYAETTFVCPSYWLAEAFTNNDRVAYKYQYSAIPAQHGVDVNAFFGPALPDQGADFLKALMTSWGNFITTDDPSIPSDIAIGGNASSVSGSGTNSTGPQPNQPNAASNWPAYSLAAPYQMNFNQSGGVPFDGSPYPGMPGLQLANVTQFSDPGLRNDISLVNAYTWEGGRGMRCDFWRSVARLVPE